MNDLSWALRTTPLSPREACASAALPFVLLVGRESFLEQMAVIIRDGGLPEQRARDESAARAILGRTPTCLVVLDGGLATPTDFSTCVRLTAVAGCPVIMVTAGDEENDRILALELGVDDCVPSTCRPRELLARIRARLRRSHRDHHAVECARGMVAAFGEWRLDLVTRQVLCPDGRWIGLAATELIILRCLTWNAGRPVPATEIIQSAQATGRVLTQNHVRVQICRLRAKLGLDSSGRKAIVGARPNSYLVPSEPEGLDPGLPHALATKPAVSATKAGAGSAAAR